MNTELKSEHFCKEGYDMLSRPEKNYFINAGLGIITLICIGSGVILAVRPVFVMNAIQLPWQQLHALTGYGMIAGVVVHLLMHSKWIKAVTSRIVGSPKKALALAMTVLVVFGLCYTALALGPKRNPPPDRERSESQWQEQSERPGWSDSRNE